MVHLVKNRPTHCAYRGCQTPLSESRTHEAGKDYCCTLCAQRGMKYDRERAAAPELQLVPASR